MGRVARYLVPDCDSRRLCQILNADHQKLSPHTACFAGSEIISALEGRDPIKHGRRSFHLLIFKTRASHVHRKEMGSESSYAGVL